MLEFAIQQYPFRLGLAEGTDPRQVPPGTLLTAENCVWKQSGRLEKRFGTSALVATIIGGGSISSAARLFCRGPELCLVDGTSLYSYSPASTAWKYIDPVPEVGLTWDPLTDTASGVAATDMALSASNQLVHAWVTGDPTATANTGTLFVQVIDRDTGALLVAPTLVDTLVTGIRTHVIGTTAYLVYRVAGTIKATTINLSTYAVAGAPTTLRSDVTSTSGWDSMVIGSTIVICYEHTAASPKLVLKSFSTALAAVTSGVVTGEAGSAMLSIGLAGAAGEQIFVAYGVNSSTSVKFATVDPSTLAQVTAPSLVEAVQIRKVSICRYSATEAVIAYQTRSSVPARTSTRLIVNSGTASIYTARGTWYAAMCTRPFMLGSRCYLALCEASPSTYTSNFDGANTYLVEVEVSANGVIAAPTAPSRYIGKVDVLVGAMPIDFEPVPTPVAVSSTETIFPLFFLGIAPTSFSTWCAGLRLVSATIGASRPVDLWRSATTSNEAFITAAAANAYDGRTVFDYGFARQPFVFGHTVNSPIGAMVAGDYIYATTLEYRSATGLLYRSPVATLGGVVTVAATPSRVTFDVFGTSLSSKQNVRTSFSSSSANTVLLPWYRSTVGGSVLQRLTIEPSYNWLQNDPLVSGQQFVDNRADANIDGLGIGTTLAARPAIYTTGGVLDDYSPPGGVTMFAHVDRLWILAGDRKTWWYSKSFQDDLGVAPGFHPNFRISFDEVQTAAGSMDDKAVFYSATGIRYMQGVGPAPNGQSSDFQVPSRIQSDVGCVNARSLVSVPDGHMFLSARGIYLLDRGLNLTWIGRPIKDTLAAYPNVTSATLVAKHNQVRFTANNNEGTGGIVLVFDYVEKQWSTFKYNDGASAIYGCPIADACMWNGAWTFVTPSGRVFVESTTSYLDVAAYVPMTLETAWVSASGPMAFHSVRNLALHGESFTDYDLSIECAFDSEAAFAQAAAFPAQCPVTVAGPLDCSVSIGTRRKCNTIRFRIRDATPTTGGVGIGRGPAFDMMGLEVGMKRGFGNTPATKRT